MTETPTDSPTGAAPRRFTGDTLVIASHNAGKVREIADLLGRFVAHFPSAGDHGVAEPEETETSFTGNAVLKARHSADATGLPALADDSGLAVAALGGDPGIYSARWAEGPGGRDFGRAMTRVEAALGDTPDRRAHFVCALALAWPDGHVEVVEGRVDGTLVWPPRGDRGFGYDPMFRPDGHELTFGEMAPDAKHAISHRADAFVRLVARCFADGPAADGAA
jgi:XTP/dITP diphosphohydrolase